MDRERIYRRAAALLAQRQVPGREPGYLLGHGERTAHLALALCRREGLAADRDVLWAAALLHDAGKGEEPHWYRSRELVLEHFPALMGEEQLAQVAHLVRYHAKRSDPEVYSDGLRLLQDADLLEHRGSAHFARILRHGGDRAALIGAWLRWRDGGLRERYRQMLHYESSRREYDRRTDGEERFFAWIMKEENHG